MPSEPEYQPYKSPEPTGRTWYVSKNPDDYREFETISEAVDAARDGDEIKVFQGVYEENLTVTKNISIVGLGDSQNRVQDDGSYDAVLIRSESPAVIEWLAAEGAIRNVTLHNPLEGETEFDVRVIGVTAGRVEIDHCVLVGERHYSILAESGTAVTVRDCVVEDSPNGVTVADGATMFCVENRITSATFALTVGATAACVIVGNTISGQVGLHGRSAIEVRDNWFDSMVLADDCSSLIAGNRIEGIIQIFDSSPTLSKNTIKFSGCVIWMHENSSPLIEGNYVESGYTLSDLAGITAGPGCNPVIRGNHFVGNTGAACVASEGSRPEIIDNVFENVQGFAICVEKNASCEARGNLIDGGSGGQAFRIHGGNNCVVYGNTIRGNDGVGLIVANGSQAVIERNRIADNSGCGLIVGGNCVVKILGNVVSGNEDGMMIYADSVAEVRENDFRGNKDGAYGIEDLREAIHEKRLVWENNQA